MAQVQKHLPIKEQTQQMLDMEQVKRRLPIEEQTQQMLDSAFHGAMDGLSPADLIILAKQRDAVRAACAGLLQALSKTFADANIEQESDVEILKGEKFSRHSAAKGKKEIARRTLPIEEENLLTSDGLAARVGLRTRQSVHDWLRKGKIVGWQGAKRGYVFPEKQLDEQGRPVEGLEQIIPNFGDGYATWFWLTTPRNSLDGMEPLVLLKKGEIQRVLNAAEGDRQGDFA